MGRSSKNQVQLSKIPRQRSMLTSKNTILYGPPGTGKTYMSIVHAVAIIENKQTKELLDEDYIAVKSRYDEYVRKDRIVFCTFHQSFSYEDFIEGIKPITDDTNNISYKIEDGVFKSICRNSSLSNELDLTKKVMVEFIKMIKSCNKKRSGNYKLYLKDITEKYAFMECSVVSINDKILELNFNHNQNNETKKVDLTIIAEISKKYITANGAKNIFNRKMYSDIYSFYCTQSEDEPQKKINELIASLFLRFHYYYKQTDHLYRTLIPNEDISLNQKQKNDSLIVKMEVQKGGKRMIKIQGKSQTGNPSIDKEIIAYVAAMYDLENYYLNNIIVVDNNTPSDYLGHHIPNTYSRSYYWSVLDLLQNRLVKDIIELIPIEKSKKYVIIIDEINRGNVSQIFGEAITAIEESKRLSEHESLKIMLNYSKEYFGVPSNLYIIGTMNTADRSAEVLDTALRRRFEFVEMKPDYDYLTDVKVNNKSIADLLKTINSKIFALKGKDYEIGHAYFSCLKGEHKKGSNDNIKVNMLMDIINYKVLPLLQEYFYNDYEKISYVLSSDYAINGFQSNPQRQGLTKEFVKALNIDTNSSEYYEVNYPDNIDIQKIMQI